MGHLGECWVTEEKEVHAVEGKVNEDRSFQTAGFEIGIAIEQSGDQR